MTISITLHWTFHVTDTEDLFGHADRVTEALLELERICCCRSVCS